MGFASALGHQVEFAAPAAVELRFGAPLFPTPRRLLVRPDIRAINQRQGANSCAVQGGVGLQRRQDPLPNPGFAPATKPAGELLPGPAAISHLAPRGTGAQAVEHRSMRFQGTNTPTPGFEHTGTVVYP